MTVQLKGNAISVKWVYLASVKGVQSNGDNVESFC